MRIHSSDHKKLIQAYTDAYKEFVQQNVSEDVLRALAHTISPFVLELPSSILQQAEDLVGKLYDFSRSPAQIQHLKETIPAKLKPFLNMPAKNSSILMAYDFHLDPETGNLKLIEVNTNASGFLLSALVNETHNMSSMQACKDLLHSFQEELSGFKYGSPASVAIVDENIPTQKMFSEFLAFKAFFKKAGWSAEFVELNDLNPEKFDLIYNRTTDFYFESPLSTNIKDAFLSGTKCITPNPKEYLLLSDKERLLDFASALNEPQLLKIRLLTQENAGECWEQRKKLFFKPLRAYGGRGVYNGVSISRKFFERILSESYVAQEYSPPIQKEDWKFDLRFYVYKKSIQHATARVYKGQVTGFRDLGSGFAPIKFT